ncbi:hypothetical protein AX15_000093 [Amanita polypyramis BW_CC]|nr:hypothetical protein AX15_000093 [Amanita polypyramis BW_CC]
MDHIQRLLTSDLVSSLLGIHPNDIGNDVDFKPPYSWLSWWNWVQLGNATEEEAGQCRWLQLSECFNSTRGHHAHDNIPRELCELIQEIRRLQIPRRPVDIDGYPSQNIIADDRGMSPKKIHEVSRMVAYLAKLLDDLKIERRRVRIVDIGAGQGYLTRTLKLYLQTTHVLALDSDQWQTRGSQIWEERVARTLRASGNTNATTPILHKTIHITPDTLIPTIDDWIRETSGEANDGNLDPVLFIALHACGSLTPDILRVCINAAHRKNITWRMAGAVVVGCCYNLIKSADFPLSKALKSMSASSSDLPALHLPSSAFNLATQIPSQWLMSPKATTSVSLSIRKVVWRALLGRELLQASVFREQTGKLLEPESNDPETNLAYLQTKVSVPCSRQWSKLEVRPLGTGAGNEVGIGIGTSPTMRLLGRLPDSAYSNWTTFLHVAGQKLNVDLSASVMQQRDSLLERRLEVLHVLRCLVGPLVESLIILDRVQWLKEEWAINDLEAPVDSDELRKLPEIVSEKQGDTARVEAINLFDQATGSGRNVAIIVVPASVSTAA